MNETIHHKGVILIKFGLCTTIERLDWIKSRGFDYIEIPLNSYANLPEEEFHALRGRLAESGVPCPVSNFFYASDMRLTGPEVDFGFAADYAKRALHRASQLGVRLVVVGSGGQRKAPEGFDRNEATAQFAKHVTAAGEIAQAYGIVVTVEAIRPASTNVLNTLAEAITLQRQIGHPNVMLMADFSQMLGAGEGMESILGTTAELLLHAHICNSHTTSCPKNREEDIYDDFFGKLKAIGYRGDMTVEVSSFERETLGTELLRKLADEYGF